MERIKLIWDFRGPNSEKTAQHHAKHLEEFANTEKLKNTIIDTQVYGEMHATAFMVVEKELMGDLRERLKPNRGQLYTEE